MKISIQLIIRSFSYAVLLFLAACATTQVSRNNEIASAQWETKAVVKNLREGRINSLDIDILGMRNERIRFEINALFGVQIASLVMSPTEISFIYYPQKKFYYGKNSENALAQLMEFPLHPMNLSYIAFDQPMKGAGWACKYDKAKLISECEQSARKVSVKWLDRNGLSKRVLITAPGFEMHWNFKEPQTSVQFKASIFTLSQPDGFKAIQIQ